MRCRLSPTADVPSHTSGAAMCQKPTRLYPNTGLGSRLPRRGLAESSADEQEVIRCQRIREIVESYLIGSCGNDGISATLGDDEYCSLDDQTSDLARRPAG